MRLACIVLLLVVARAAMANEFYIDPDHGSDAGDGSAAHPWRALQSVFDDGLIETRDWPSYPYVPGMQLVSTRVLRCARATRCGCAAATTATS